MTPPRRLTSLLGFLALWGCDSSPASSLVRQDLDSNDAMALEREAAAPWLAGDREQIAVHEAALDRALHDGYSASPATAAGHQQIVRTALIHWARLVRQHLREPMHTAVPALADDTDCQGSVIGDHVLIDYLDAALGNAERVDGVVDGLSGLARHTACLGELQLQQLATQMVVAFDDVAATLAMNGLGSALPYVAQAVSSPMLLVHDVDRRSGPDAPLAHWFADHEAVLVDGATTKHHPASWHGLWLYDRMTGRLRGFREDVRVIDENRVDLAALFHTVAEPAADDGRCSFAEMVQRGVDAGRYACNGKLCEDSKDPTCLTPGAGDSAPEPGHSIDIPGLSTSTEIDCISTQATATPQKRQMMCAVEATGLLSSPHSLLAKQLQPVTFAGTKIGDQCALSETAADATYHKALDTARRAFAAELQSETDKMHEAVDELDARQSVRDADALTKQQNPSPANVQQAADSQADVDAQAAAIAKLQADNAAALAAAAAARDAAIRAAEVARKEAADKAEQEKKKAANDGGSSSSQFCEPGSASCGNGCGAMAAQAQALLDCFADATDPRQSDPMTGPGGCHGTCDPIDPKGTVPSGLACTKALELTPSSSLSEGCWSARCGPTDHAGSASACCGHAGITSTGEPELAGLCGNLDCGEGDMPTVIDGKCACGPSNPIPGNIVIPPPPMGSAEGIPPH